MTKTVRDEDDALTDSLNRLITALRESPDQTITGWENLLTKAGMANDSELSRTIHAARRRPNGSKGQLAVLTHGRFASDFMWTTDRNSINRQRLRHMRIAYAYDLHVYWSEHQEWDRMQGENVPKNVLFDMNYEMRKSQENLAAAEAKIVSLGRALGIPDRKIATFFREPTPNDPATVHALV